MHSTTKNRFDLTGRSALVTGASSGLGRHFAHVLAAAGANVIAAARRRDKLQSLVADLERAGARARCIELDVTDRDQVRRAFTQIGAPNVIVNNAGVAQAKRALEFADEEWDAIIDTNLKGAWIVAQEGARAMIAAGKRGSIINITSILASRVAGAVSPYAASKAGLAHLTRALALELARDHIRVNSIAPGYFDTDMNAGFLDSEAGQKLKARIPQQRFGKLEDLDGALLLLASDAGAYITGAEIVVDGGHLSSTL